MLQQMLDKQRELQKRLGTEFSELDSVDRAAFMRNHFVYLDQELQEALYEVPYFKLWKDYSGMTDRDYVAAWNRVKMELVDAFHFFMNLMLCAGMDANEMYEMYMAKNAENHRRQDAGYTHDISYKDQEVEDVVEDVCIVRHGNELLQSDTFAAVLFDKEHGMTVVGNADVFDVLIASIALRAETHKMLANLDDETLKEVLEHLEGFYE